MMITAMNSVQPSNAGAFGGRSESMKYRPIPEIEKICLGDDQATEQIRGIERHHGDERDDRVAERVLEDHLAARYALRAGAVRT